MVYKQDTHSHSALAGHGHAHGSMDGPGAPSHGDEHHVMSGMGFVAREHAGGQQEALARGAGRGKMLFLQLPSGIAGDMTVAALLDLGVPSSVVHDTIRALGLGDVEIAIRRGHAGTMTCTHFGVSFAPQPSRNFSDITRLIDRSEMATAAKALAIRIFERLGRAEAQVHGVPIESVHFHEVGAVDSIVDICCAAAALTFLDARVCASPVPIGAGFVECEHGVLPLPAPATALCLTGVPTVASGLDVELVTPTGAAILSTVSEGFAPWPSIVPERVGYGAGTKTLVDRPNVVRAILGAPNDEFSAARAGTHALLEVNLDDMTGECVAHALAQVMASGALDCWVVPATMKKGRPGMVFCALTDTTRAQHLAEVILRETTSLGVRQTLVTRYELPRRVVSVPTEFGAMRVKISERPGDDFQRFKPELEDCLGVARATGLPLTEIVARVVRSAALEKAEDA